MNYSNIKQIITNTVATYIFDSGIDLDIAMDMASTFIKGENSFDSIDMFIEECKANEEAELIVMSGELA